MSADLLFSAGKIARKVKEEAAGLVREGESLIAVCEHVERRIEEKGGRPAFPCNICIDEVAAHYSSLPRDRAVIPPNSLVKIDVGAQVEGFIADTAVTVSLDPQKEAMVIAAEDALRNAVKIVKAGIRASDIGSVIQSVVEKHGFRPISNLTGHEIDRFNLHAGLSIPNVSTKDRGVLQEKRVYAIEPFVTLRTASGEVRSSEATTIYALKRKHTRLRERDRTLLERIDREFHGLPYSPRWLVKAMGEDVLEHHRGLWMKGKIYGYPVLVEKSGAPVAQAEATVLVTRDGCKVTT